MLAIGLRFPAGRYHATPWGRHVNEADLAWPPDLWRLSRAFVATWHRKLDPANFSRDSLRELLAALAGEAPVYRLPAAVHTHTRHYMPVRDKNALIFDAFARVDPAEEMIVAWRAVKLSDGCTDLLDALLGALGYLGRAESWVEARRIPDWRGTPNCLPQAADAPVAGGRSEGEAVTLVLPRSPEDYGAFRLHTLQELDARIVRPRERRDAAATLPEDWLDALAAETADLQRAGWSQPPAARFVPYVRPAGCLRPAPSPKPKIAANADATSVRFALYGRPLPRVEDALRVGEWLRQAVLSKAGDILGKDRIPPALSGHDLPEGGCHGHAFYLPEDADGDGRIDHLVIHAPLGLDGPTQRALGQLVRLWNRDGQEWRLVLENLGQAAQIGAQSLLLGSSRTWISLTPYLHPWHRKKNLGVEDQLRRECSGRRLPAVMAAEPLPSIRLRGRDRRPVHFHRIRSKRGLTQPDTHGGFWRLTFAEPVQGPLALGFGCHFGLGLFQSQR
jgi:CRISPR-associated protein Csb2